MTTEWALGQFGTTLAVERANYQKFMQDGLGEGHRPEFHGKGEVDSRLLGDDRFMERCLEGCRKLPIRLSVGEIISVVCRRYGIDETVLQTSSQSRKISEARAAAGWLARELGCGTLTEVARVVNRDVGSMSSAVRRLMDRMDSNPQLAAHLQTLKGECENKLDNLEA